MIMGSNSKAGNPNLTPMLDRYLAASSIPSLIWRYQPEAMFASNIYISLEIFYFQLIEASLTS